MKHLLIIGAARSGTSLLTWLLGSQDGIALSSEVKRKAWRRVVGHEVVGTKLCIPTQIELDTLSWLDKANIRIRKICLRPLHHILGSRIPRPYRPGDMSIRDFTELESPLIVAIFRDPHEVILSNRSRGRQPDSEAKKHYRRAIEVIHATWSEYPDITMLVDFDMLIAEPDSIVRACCDRLGQPFDQSRISGYTKNYRQPRIDSSKAKGRGSAERLAHPIFDAEPELRDRYAALIEAAPHTLCGPGECLSA